jgi:hypothetical protein
VPDDATDDDGEGDDQPAVSIGSEGFQPDADEAGEGAAAGDAQRTTAGDAQRTTAGAENAVPPPEEAFGWRGWVLVGVLVVSLVVFPVVVTLRPVRVVGFRTTYLVLPLLPAFLLGATAVWVALRSRQG